MNFYRVEPFPHETFYVLAPHPDDLRTISNNQICFSPVNYAIEPVEPGDMPAHAKIVAIERADRRIRRVTLETAMQIMTGKQSDNSDEITTAVETLKMALQKGGLNAPVRIELQDSDQAIKLASLFGGKLTPKASNRLISSISGGNKGFAICGVVFTWSTKQHNGFASLVKKTQRVLGLK